MNTLLCHRRAWATYRLFCSETLKSLKLHTHTTQCIPLKCNCCVITNIGAVMLKKKKKGCVEPYGALPHILSHSGHQHRHQCIPETIRTKAFADKTLLQNSMALYFVKGQTNINFFTFRQPLFHVVSHGGKSLRFKTIWNEVYLLCNQTLQSATYREVYMSHVYQRRE